jgi:hypothetical protein
VLAALAKRHACDALTCHQGEYFACVGEWMGGCANPHFFAQLVATFETG